MITSPENPKLKLIRRLAERRARAREGLFVAEGEDLVEAARAAGREPELLLRGGVDVDQALLDSVSALGSGTRVIGVYRQAWAEPDRERCVYLHAVGDPRNVGAIIRSTDALLEATVVLGPDCADPHSGRAVRASMGSIFSQPLARAPLERTPAPRVALVAHGGEAPGSPDPATICLGAERLGLPEDVLRHCERRWTIPLRRGGAESLNVAAAAAITLGRISSAA